jgi:tRNA-(ms[2]io[6]A)-hydroxylase
VTDISHILEFLDCPTPDAWVRAAVAPGNLPILLADHANCEMKAAQSAMAVMTKYKAGVRTVGKPVKNAASTLESMHRNTDHDRLLTSLSRLAREELRHFEQVIALMKARSIGYPQLSAARYAAELRKLVRTHEPARLVDTLLTGAIIEARSCERFAALVPHLDEELAGFYASLLKSEARHFTDYLKLAEGFSSAQDVALRLPVLLRRESALIQEPDPEFRFHSGIPCE